MNRPKRSLPIRDYAETDSSYIPTESDSDQIKFTKTGPVYTPDRTNMTSNDVIIPKNPDSNDNNLINLDKSDDDDDEKSNANTTNETPSPQDFIEGDDSNKTNIVNPPPIPGSNNSENVQISGKKPKKSKKSKKNKSKILDENQTLDGNKKPKKKSKPTGSKTSSGSKSTRLPKKTSKSDSDSDDDMTKHVDNAGKSLPDKLPEVDVDLSDFSDHTQPEDSSPISYSDIKTYIINNDLITNLKNLWNLFMQYLDRPIIDPHGGKHHLDGSWDNYYYIPNGTFTSLEYKYILASLFYYKDVHILDVMKRCFYDIDRSYFNLMFNLIFDQFKNKNPTLFKWRLCISRTFTDLVPRIRRLYCLKTVFRRGYSTGYFNFLPKQDILAIHKKYWNKPSISIGPPPNYAIHIPTDYFKQFLYFRINSYIGDHAHYLASNLDDILNIKKRVTWDNTNLNSTKINPSLQGVNASSIGTKSSSLVDCDTTNLGNVIPPINLDNLSNVHNPDVEIILPDSSDEKSNTSGTVISNNTDDIINNIENNESYNMDVLINGISKFIDMKSLKNKLDDTNSPLSKLLSAEDADPAKQILNKVTKGIYNNRSKVNTSDLSKIDVTTKDPKEIKLLGILDQVSDHINNDLWHLIKNDRLIIGWNTLNSIIYRYFLFRARIYKIAGYLEILNLTDELLKRGGNNLCNGAAWAKLVGELIKHENAYRTKLGKGVIRLQNLKDPVPRDKILSHLVPSVKHFLNGKHTSKRRKVKSSSFGSFTDHTSNDYSSYDVYNNNFYKSQLNLDDTDFDSNSQAKFPDLFNLNGYNDDNNNNGSDDEDEFGFNFSKSKKIKTIGKFNNLKLINYHNSEQKYFDVLAKLRIYHVLKVYSIGIILHNNKRMAINNIQNIKDNLYFYSGKKFINFILKELGRNDFIYTVILLLPLIKFVPDLNYWSNNQVCGQVSLFLYDIGRGNWPKVFSGKKSTDLKEENIGFNISNMKVKPSCFFPSSPLVPYCFKSV